MAYQYGMVVSTCKHCRSNHLIADNQGKLDMQEFGSKIEDYLIAKGESVQKLSITPKELEDNYICDKDGVVTLIPKMGGQVSLHVYLIVWMKMLELKVTFASFDLYIFE